MSTENNTSTPPTTPPTAALAANLGDTPRNHTSAAKALARLAYLGWEPVGPYPGSDTLWHVRCQLCGWDGPRFYSHLGRNRPISRHPDRACIPVNERPAHMREPLKRA
ncbi:hypothetical protein [Streptomyces celluloflavus]|uniref:hypothetical protein n=1 Tax=Streptomyces celluloflavus TaxID=58344 RepID=UPI003682E3C6